MIIKCVILFNLFPTSQAYRWLIAADWLEEEGLDVTASAFRENLFHLEMISVNGHGDGNGYSDDIGAFYNIHGTGLGCGHSDGYGFGDGDGDGGGWSDGDGSIDEYGFSRSYGWDEGSGWGDGGGTG
jgi:hypothetical protein